MRPLLGFLAKTAVNRAVAFLLNGRTESANWPRFRTLPHSLATKPCRASQPGCPDVVVVGHKQNSRGRGTPMSANITSNHLTKRRTQLFGATALLLLSLTATPSLAQGLQPGEAFATRFSGTAPGADGSPTIDTDGTVGSILDLRNPGQPPQGQHWINEPQRNPITAARNRPGVRRRVRRRQSPEHLCHRHRRVRPAPYRATMRSGCPACSAAAVPARSTSSTPPTATSRCCSP